MMDQKKIVFFLKQLRNEMGITQEQLAEIFSVSGRTRITLGIRNESSRPEYSGGIVRIL